MKIATLQFSPRLGEVAANFSRAESLLMREEREDVLQGLDLLVLPELAFTGKDIPLIPCQSASRNPLERRIHGVKPRRGLEI